MKLCFGLLLLILIIYTLLKVVLCTLAFTAFELPPNGAVGTKILEFLFHSRPDLVRILSITIYLFLLIYFSYHNFVNNAIVGVNFTLSFILSYSFGTMLSESVLCPFINPQGCILWERFSLKTIL